MQASKSDSNMHGFFTDPTSYTCLLTVKHDSSGNVIDLCYEDASPALSELFPKVEILKHVKNLSYFDLSFFPQLLGVVDDVIKTGKTASFDFEEEYTSHPYRCDLFRASEVEVLASVSKAPQVSRDRQGSRPSVAGLKSFFDTGPIKFVIDPVSREILDANQTASSFYGWSRQQFQEMTLDELDANLSGRINEGIQNVENHSYSILHVKHKLASGEIRDVEVHASVGQWNGKHVHFSIVLERIGGEEIVWSPRARSLSPAACSDVQECFGPFLERYKSAMPYLDELMEDLLPFGRRIRYRKGEHFLEFGGLSPTVGFITSGLFRQYTITIEGSDCTLGLYRPGQILDTFAYAEFDKECPLAFEARCASEVFIVDSKVLRPLINRDPRWWKLFYYNLSARLISRNEREISLLSEDALTRYHRCLASEGDSLAFLQSNQIASYLGITSETLSRIRNKGNDMKSAIEK